MIKFDKTNKTIKTILILLKQRYKDDKISPICKLAVRCLDITVIRNILVYLHFSLTNEFFLTSFNIMKHISLILISIILFACHKEEHPALGGGAGCGQEIHTTISRPELKDFFFKQGSYWVYMDSLNLSYSDTLKIDYPTSYGDFQSAPYSCRYNETFTFIGWSRTMVEQTDREYIIKPDSFITLSRYQHSKNTVMFLPVGTPNNPCVFYDSLFVYDRYYKNVIKSDTIRGANGISFKMVCYFNSQYGFLRNDLFNSSNQLISRKLVYAKNVIK